MTDYRPEILNNYDQCGTIQDLIVTVFGNRKKPLMSTQNAASWGYFDVNECSWNRDILNRANFPVHLLPTVVQPGTNFGTLHDTIYCIRKGAIIGRKIAKKILCSIL